MVALLPNARPFPDRRLHALALRLAPELARAPLYVLAHADGDPLPPGCWGYALGRIDFANRQWLIDAGAWCGMGPAIVLVPDLADQQIITLLHELAHVLPAQRPPPDRAPSADERTAEARSIAGWAALPPLGESNLPLWFGHGERFIRRALHLWHRCTSDAPRPPPGDLCAGFRYGLSAACHYYRALLPELRSTSLRAEFAEIEAAPPQPAFAALFAADTAAAATRKTA